MNEVDGQRYPVRWHNALPVDYNIITISLSRYGFTAHRSTMYILRAKMPQWISASSLRLYALLTPTASKGKIACGRMASVLHG